MYTKYEENPFAGQGGNLIGGCQGAFLAPSLATLAPWPAPEPLAGPPGPLRWPAQGADLL